MNSTDHSSATAGIHSRLFTIREVSELAGVSIMTVRRWIESHGLQIHRLGRLVRISQADLGDFIEGKRQHKQFNGLYPNSE
jgi:excisionase family DNA binding protein